MTLLFDLSRTTPVVVLSPDPRRKDGLPLIDPTRLCEQIGGQAEIAVLTDHAAASNLRDLIPHLGVWGGAARVFRPGATPDDAKHRHPLVQISPGRTDEAVTVIQHQLLGHGLVYSTTTPQSDDNHRGQHSTGDRSGDSSDDVEHLRTLLAAEKRTTSALRQKIRRLSKGLKAAEERAEADTTTVYADPEQQFRYEVDQCWLRLVPEPDRPGQPIATFTLGPDWLASLDAIELVDRRKTVEVTVEVLTGLAATIPGRQVHRMRARDERGGAPLVRDDQAVAMRCHLKNQTSAAPRLMWWKLPDQSIELARVAPHDDTYLR
ncbi:hypothetical protein ACIBBE_45595 [Streptomyces sp. NPDC051644]|uniref:hypothetical protein n=1 Tax=Streptomyces sp. NPDC051644 TaxID=3365666 RepID=UPI0037A44F32